MVKVYIAVVTRQFYARVKATSTGIVVLHAVEKRSDDQWYKSISRSSE